MMPTLTVTEASSVSLFYLDSGPVAESGSYTTVFTLHGHTYHTPIFSRIIALAPSYNLRIVAITRRDYPGSTPFSEEELRVASKGSRKEKLGFLRDRAIEIWEFVRKFVKVNSIPRWNKSDGKGGVVVMGWSMGNSQGLGAMAYAREIKGVREELEPWMKGYIIYESHLGHQPPDPLPWYSPFQEKSLPASGMIQAIRIMLSSYFKHPNISTLELSGRPSPHRRCTEETFTEQEVASFIDIAAGQRVDTFFSRMEPEVAMLMRREALAPTIIDNNEVIWEDMEVTIIVGDETRPEILYAASELKKELDGWAVLDGRKVRRFKQSVLEGGNHFAHWDDSDKFMSLLRDLVQ